MANKMIRGMDKLLRDLRKLDPTKCQEVLFNGMEAGGIVIKNRWQQLAPFKTGHYRRSIAVVRERTRVVIGTDIVDPPYPFWLEFGTRRMPKGKPSARPAVDQSEKLAKSDMKSAIARQLHFLLPGNRR